jgi:lipopolysaccharide export system protein LptA
MKALFMIRPALPALTFAAVLLTAGLALAQGMAVGFGGLWQDPAAPVEVTSDGLTVDQATGRAVFDGNVLVVQGALRMTAARVEVEYGDAGQGIRSMNATGGVTLVTAAEAAESREARYEVASGALVMTGAVLLTQGQATISGERLVADLRAGTGQMQGRVKTVFQPGTKGGN